MDRLHERLAVAIQALSTLNELVHKTPVSKIERDAAIQRFEYTSEAVWKAGQAYLRQQEGLDLGSPKGVIRAFLQIHQFEEAEAQLAMNMIDDRNLAVHTYNEALADAMYQRLGKYAQLMDKWIGMMKKMNCP